MTQIKATVHGGRYDGLLLALNVSGDYHGNGSLVRIETATLEDLLGTPAADQENLPSTTVFRYTETYSDTHDLVPLN
jgi:hypothetical protein